jgi:DNA-binding NarL/FixJ family response regulator
MEDIRVLVVDEGLGLAQSLLLAVSPRSSIKVLGPVADIGAAIELMREAAVHLAVVDMDREDGRGPELVGLIRDADRYVRVLVATRNVGAESATIALAAGACGVLPPQRDRSLIAVFQRAAAGELVLPAADLPQLVDQVRTARVDRSEPERLATLTHREREILRGLSEGISPSELAQRLEISPLTVQSHVKNILAKLGVHTKVEAVRIAWRYGLSSVTRTA